MQFYSSQSWLSSQGQITIPAGWLVKLGVRKKGQKVPTGTTIALVEEDGKMIIQEAKNRAREGFGILKKYIDPSLLSKTDEELEKAIEDSKLKSFKPSKGSVLWKRLFPREMFEAAKRGKQRQ